MLINEKTTWGRVADETIYGALDLGTNNCRLLLAVPQGDGFQVVDAFSRMTRLGQGLAASGQLAAPAVERTLTALKFCAHKLERRRVRRLRAVATEACRRAANCADFLARARSETGIAIEIISADEEASLALAGCSPLLAPQPEIALVFDIGGGSTELIRVRRQGDEPRADSIVSLPFGVVTLAEQYGDQLLHGEGYEQVVAGAMEQLRAFDPAGELSHLARHGQLQMLGTSGTVTTLAGIHLDLQRYDRALVDGLSMDFATIEAVSRTLQGLDFASRANHPCIGRERADLVVAGCAILAGICRLWPTGRLRVADRGVREGILLSLMRADRAAAPA
jgi:exopolyphosphatase/guanosine-5'-triphosphate,3'-diphosphate pyrophosphatase